MVAIMQKTLRKELTGPQAKILRYVISFQRSKGFPPTRGELCDKFGWKSKNSAQEHLVAIERKGWLRLWPETPRGISVL